jgi:signal peptidase I
MNARWKTRLIQLWRGWGCVFAVVLVVTFSLRSSIADWNDVPTGSMKPTIIEGDRIFVNKLAYDLKVPFTTWHLAQWNDPERWDIVVFFSPQDGKRLVKRVVGLPGDTIAIMKNRLFINGEAAEYGPIDRQIIEPLTPEQQSRHLFFTESISGKKHPVMITPSTFSRRSFGPVSVPEGCYFMMGDNRDNSADSRHFGFVERKLVVGRATAVVMSLKRDRHYLPRWDRFFHGLN